MCVSLSLPLSFLTPSVCFLRHTGACLFSRRFRERRDAVFPDAAVKEPVPRLHTVAVYTRSFGRVTDVTKLNRPTIIIATPRDAYVRILWLLNEFNRGSLAPIVGAIDSFAQQTRKKPARHRSNLFISLSLSSSSRMFQALPDKRGHDLRPPMIWKPSTVFTKDRSNRERDPINVELTNLVSRLARNQGLHCSNSYAFSANA